MEGGNSAGSPLEAAAGAAGAHAIEAFELLGNETRLAILLALWEAYDPTADDNSVSFSVLYDRVEYDTTANFSYHLEKLEGHFVRKADDGYELRRGGRKIVQAIIAGTGIEDPTLEPTEIDASCKYCGASTAITYEHAWVYQVCTDCQGWSGPEDEHPSGALVAWTFDPTGLSNRTAEEIFAASTVKTYGRIAMRFEGICPECSGEIEWSLDICEDHDPASDGVCPTCGRKEAVVAQESCTVCKSSGEGSPSIKVMFHPAVIAFYYDHGVEWGFTGTTDFEDVVQHLKLVNNFEQELVSANPPQICVTVRYEGDELRLTLNEEMNVINVGE